MIRQNKPSTPNTFHVLGENEATGSGDRNKNDSAGKVASSISGANSARRTPTPSKQITLQHVKRRDDSDVSNEKVDIEEIRQSLSRENSEIFLTESKDVARGKENKPSHKPHRCEDKPSKPPFVVRSNAGLKPFTSDGNSPPERAVQEKKVTKVLKKTEERNEENTKDEDESSDDSSSDEEEEKRRAPTELLMEFLECLMQKDYPNASKLCKMILIYEPDHATALKFQPVIEERLQLDKEAEEEGSDDDEDDDDDDDDDDSDDDSDDDDSGNSDSDSEEDEDDEENQPNVAGPSSEFDSGILSANSDG